MRSGRFLCATLTGVSERQQKADPQRQAGKQGERKGELRHTKTATDTGQDGMHTAAEAGQANEPRAVCRAAGLPGCRLSDKDRAEANAERQDGHRCQAD